MTGFSRLPGVGKAGPGRAGPQVRRSQDTGEAGGGLDRVVRRTR